jgi:phage major head subunit gpT-like protein
MANPITSQQFVRLLDKRLSQVDENVFAELPSMIPQFFNVMPSDSAFDEYYEIGSLGDIEEFNGTLNYLSLTPDYYKKIEPKEFAGGVIMERKLMDNKKYAVMDGMAKELATSAQRTQEKLAARSWNYAFSNAFDFQTSEEGLSLCNSAHTTKDTSVSTTNGFSNAGTSALSKTALSATYLAMRRFRNNIGERIDIEPDTLIVPDALGDLAEEICGTPTGYDTAASNKNSMSGRFKVIRYKRLDDYSTTNWFMVDSRLMKKFLIWINRVNPEPGTTVDWETYAIKHKIYFSVGYGFLNWRWIYGHNVS